MNESLSFLYDCNCDTCKNQKQQVNLAAGPSFKQLLNTAEKAFKKLHSNGQYKPEDLNQVKEYKALVDASAKLFDGAIQDNDIPAEMLQSLQNDVFVFSALRTHAELFEASRQLLTDDGKVKSFSQFSKDVAGLKKDYNQDYLEAEYQFAVTSAQMAGKWAQVSNDYDLQYRTAGDERVRASHAALNSITLPADDAFWLSYYPPNGWRCRCNAVQVRKGKYDVSDSNKAIAAGEAATHQEGKDGKNRLEIFRFNPGAQKVIFPPGHPYNKVQGAATVKKEAVNQTIDQLENLPDNFKKYAKDNNLDLDNAYYMFSKIRKPIAFEEWRESYYRANVHKVVIAKNQKGLRKTVIHEFGHGIDAENKFYEHPKTLALMGKYIVKYGRAGLAELDNKVKTIGNSHDVTCVRDTIMSLSINSGAGHTKAYFKADGGKNRPKEFLAHCFENRFDGNDIFEKYAPEMFEDMKTLIDDLLNEIE